MTTTDQISVNQEYWDEAAELHRVAYDTDTLVSGERRLSDAVAEDSRLLAPFLPGGSVKGLDLLHLQCHIGSDTLSWARLGARTTGVDLSPESLRIARDLAQRAGVEVEYVQSSINDAAEALAGRQFDLVYTSMGVLAWLDDLDRWASLIAQVLRDGGTFFIHEGHPMAMSLDENATAGDLRLGWPYFNVGVLEDTCDVDYSGSPVKHGHTYYWSHPLSEIIGSLLRAGLTLVDFQEYQTLAWKLVEWMVPAENNGYTLPEPLRDLCPLAFTIVARK